jgi:hypothetical protein
MNTSEILNNYNNLIDRLIEIGNAISPQQIIRDGSLQLKVGPKNPIPIRNSINIYYLVDNGKSIRLVYSLNRKSWFIAKKFLTNQRELYSAINAARKPIEKDIAIEKERLAIVKTKFLSCINLIDDYRLPIVEYLNKNNLPCEYMSLKNNIIYLGIQQESKIRDFPIYTVKTSLPVKLVQYKGAGYSSINHDYKKAFRKYLRETKDLKQFIF